jgi:hypothetical protein
MLEVYIMFKNNPIDQLLKWFEQEPRTINWDAILAYDKGDTNTVLLQEYIIRQNTNDLMDPITEEVTDGASPTYKAYLFEYVFDAPRLSFENANIAESKAMLTCRVIDGVHVTFEMSTGSSEWSVVKLGSHSPLTAPPLTTPINLLNVSGEVTDVGRVVLNISEGTDYRFAYDDTPHLQRTLGNRLRQAFARLPSAQKEYELNILKVGKDDYLKPKEFLIRTHAPDGASVKGALNFGEGQVLLFVTMEGGKNGAIPGLNKDMQYLIPDGSTAALVLGHNFMVKKIISEGAEGIINGGDDYTIELEGPEGGFVQKLTVQNGARRRGSFGAVTHLPHFQSFELVELILGVGKTFIDLAPGTSSFDIKFENQSLVVSWEGTKQQPVKIIPRGGSLLQNNLGTHWRLRKRFSYKLLPSGDLRMEVDENFNELLIRVTPELYVGVPEVSEHFAEIANYVGPLLEAELEAGITEFLKKSEVIDQFRLNNLLFRGEQPVQLEKVAFPGDLVSFGKVGPTQTEFVIDQIETLVGVGKTLQFNTIPPTAGVNWTVENIGDHEGNPGTIIPTSGLYTAPTQIDGRQLRIRVKASKGVHSSYALVSVLSFDIDISPQIQVVGAGNASGREMRAGTQDKQDSVKWEVVNGDSTGSRVVPSAEENGDHTYFAGPRNPDVNFTVDEIVVSTTVAPVKTQSSYVLVPHLTLTETLVILDVPDLPANQIQLAAIDRNGDPYPADEYIWDVPIGAGTVDANGRVTINDSSPFPFIAVTATYPDDRRGDMIGCKLLPVPLFSVPDTIRMLRV